MILMMDQGSVVEQGTHAELMALALLLPLPNKKNYCNQKSIYPLMPAGGDKHDYQQWRG